MLSSSDPSGRSGNIGTGPMADLLRCLELIQIQSALRREVRWLLANWHEGMAELDRRRTILSGKLKVAIFGQRSDGAERVPFFDIVTSDNLIYVR